MPASQSRRERRQAFQLGAASVKDTLQSVGVDLELVNTLRAAIADAIDSVLPKTLQSWTLLEKASVRESLRMQLATITDETVKDARGKLDRCNKASLDNPWRDPDIVRHFE